MNARYKRRRPICGVGINDYEGKIWDGGRCGSRLHSYRVWQDMIIRCCSDEYKRKHPAYKDCKIANEWIFFSNFKKWYDENYREGYHLDKDILMQGNKLYSPSTCCFVPSFINESIPKRRTVDGAYKCGVYQERRGAFIAQIGYKNKGYHIGRYKTFAEAFDAYRVEKTKQIQNNAKIALERGQISNQVYEALMRFEVKMN